jgi:RNA polymerase sigma-70 factor (ECF subfamily)
MWHQVHEPLKAFIRKRVSNDAEADDILQEVFVRLHRGVDRLHDRRRLVSWIYQITRHVIIDRYRAAERRRELPVGLARDVEERDAGLSKESEPAAKTELSGCLRPMLDRLPAEYREAINLVELEGLTHQEAAGRIGLSVPGMKSRVQRGRRLLRQLLDECCLIELDPRRGVAAYELRRPGPGC